MKDILKAPFVEEMKKMTANMYRLGWDERNGGNISWMLEADEVDEYLDTNAVIRTIPIGLRISRSVSKVISVHLPFQTHCQTVPATRLPRAEYTRDGGQ